MNRVLMGVSALAFASSFAVAGETFGGIGITIYGAPCGVQVVDVIPGSPASEAGLESGDFICAVDGTALPKNNLDASKDVLRGMVGKPLELSVVREKDTLSVTLRRVQLSVKDLDANKVSAWYGDQKSEYSAAELSAVASSEAGSGYNLLSVMQNGRVLPEEASVNARNVTMIAVAKDAADTAFTKDDSDATAPQAASLLGFNRNAVSFNLYKNGTVKVRILKAHGEQVAVKLIENAAAGANSVSWDGAKASDGRYLVRIEQNGAVSSFAVEVQ